MVWATRTNVGAGAAHYDRDFVRKRKSSSAWNGALESQIYVRHDVLFYFIVSLVDNVAFGKRFS